MKFLYPYGKEKALTLSYDDGNMPDLRLVDLFNKYGVKATFNLNSKKSLSEHTEGELRHIYNGHEVASHGLEHKFPTQLSPQGLHREFALDKAALEKVFRYPVRGAAYAFGDYNEEVKRTLISLGLHYARVCQETQDFFLPKDFLEWTPTCHHNNHLMELADRFLTLPDWRDLPLFYVWGHSYEFEGEDGIGFPEMEAFLQKISGRDDIYYATNIEIYDYITALKQLEIWDDGKRFYNPTAKTIWFRDDERVIRKLAPQKSLLIR